MICWASPVGHPFTQQRVPGQDNSISASGAAHGIGGYSSPFYLASSRRGVAAPEYIPSPSPGPGPHVYYTPKGIPFRLPAATGPPQLPQGRWQQHPTGMASGGGLLKPRYPLTQSVLYPHDLHRFGLHQAAGGGTAALPPPPPPEPEPAPDIRMDSIDDNEILAQLLRPREYSPGRPTFPGPGSGGFHGGNSSSMPIAWVEQDGIHPQEQQEQCGGGTWMDWMLPPAVAAVPASAASSDMAEQALYPLLHPQGIPMEIQQQQQQQQQGLLLGHEYPYASFYMNPCTSPAMSTPSAHHDVMWPYSMADLDIQSGSSSSTGGGGGESYTSPLHPPSSSSSLSSSSSSSSPSSRASATEEAWFHVSNPHGGGGNSPGSFP